MDDRARDRIRWHSRRGLLENDLLLTRFLDHNLAGMSQEDMGKLDKLLRLDDNDLLDLLMGRSLSSDEDINQMVANIRGADCADAGSSAAK